MKWTTLRHNGVAFPPPDECRGLTVKIKSERVKLEPLQEEMLMAWAKKKNTPYVQDPVFQQNFLGDLKRILPERLADISLADIDWSELHAIADREKTANLPPEEKRKRSAERKAERERLKVQFGAAIVDGVETEVGAYLVEPPGILMGRGAHPLRGRWKRRVEPRDLTLNLDENAPVPEGDWGEIVHDHDSMWIASWYDELSDKRKYIWLADSSRLRQERDKEKYLKAAKLETGLERVREKIRAGMGFEDTRARLSLERRESKLRAAIQLFEAKILRATAAGDTEARKKHEDELASLRKDVERLDQRRQTHSVHVAEMKTRQIATVCYLIDRLAMRVGDEKDEDEADTVGASTLRVEHVKIHADSIEFDFLGKDSVQWQKFLPLNSNGYAIFARNVQDFMRGKQPGEQIFDKIDSTHVNRFLGSALPGLTAKVFRTYHATTTVCRFLRASEKRLQEDAAPFEKEYVAKRANLEAAIACNHKRTPPKNWEQSLANKEAALRRLRAIKPKSDKARARLKERIEKARRQLELAKATRDYNLGTSLKNYIDPRVYKAWGDHVGFDWKRLYTKTLQRKFAWVNLTRPKWNANAKRKG